MKTMKLAFAAVKATMAIFLTSIVIGIEYLFTIIWMWIPGLNDWIPDSIDKLISWMESQTDSFELLQ